MLEKSPAIGLDDKPLEIRPLPVPAKATMMELRQALADKALPVSCRATGLSRTETVSRVLKHLRETARTQPKAQ